MRAQLSSLVAALTLAGCVSGTRTIVVREYPAATPAPAPRPLPAPLPTPRRLMQLEVALGNPSAGKVPVQTNRAAYVAIFEIVPQQGVTLLHPSTAKQGRTVLSGLSWITVGLAPAPTARRVSNSARPARYIYALASDTPLPIPDRAIEPAYLEQLLGPAAFRAASPQAAVRALSRQFAPRISDEQWAEDLFAVERSSDAAPPRMARIYCENGRMYEVPEDIADRAWCPARGTGVMPTPTRPDSVVGGNGRRMGPRVPRTPGRTADVPQGKPEHPAKPDHPVKPRDDQAEREKAEKEKAEKDKADKDKAEKERADKDKAEKQKAEKYKAEKDRADKETADKEQAEKDRADKAKAEKDRAEKEQSDKDRADKAQQEKAEKDKADREKAEKQKAEKDAADKAAKDKADKDAADKAAKDKADKERSDDASDAESESGKPDESDKSNKGAKDAGDRKPADKSKSIPKADSTKNVGSRSTPTRGRTAP